MKQLTLEFSFTRTFFQKSFSYKHGTPKRGFVILKTGIIIVGTKFNMILFGKTVGKLNRGWE